MYAAVVIAQRFVITQKNINDEDALRDHSPEVAFKDALNNHFTIDGFINIKDMGAAPTPEYVEGPVATAFHEGAISLVVGNWNAAGTMFRLAIDLVTVPLLPATDENRLNSKVRRDLGLRLPWLFENGFLPSDLRELSKAVREDGNDGAHAAALEKDDALDLLDFTRALLERIVTEPRRIELAERRRGDRRKTRE